MSTVFDFNKCPRCGGVYYKEFNCRTQEEWRSCNRCGYGEQWFLLRDDEGELILDENKCPQMQYKELSGYGIACVEYKSGGGRIVGLDKPLDEKMKDDFFTAICDASINRHASSLIAYNPETKKLEAIFGEMPESYEEFCDSIDVEEESSEEEENWA